MSDETIFREVDDELRAERMRSVWRRFGPYVIGAAVAVVLVVAVNEGWRWWQGSNAARSSDQYFAALELAEAGDVAAAQEALNAVIAEGSGDYPLLARFTQAALLGRDGRTEEAVAAYDALAGSTGNQRLRELALLMAAGYLVDSADVAAVQARVGGLVDGAGPLRNSARETLGLTQYAAGDREAALASFNAIVEDPLAPADLVGRTEVYIDQIIAEGDGELGTVPAAPAPSDDVVVPTLEDLSGDMLDPLAPAPSGEVPSLDDLSDAFGLEAEPASEALPAEPVAEEAPLAEPVTEAPVVADEPVADEPVAEDAPAADEPEPASDADAPPAE